jgi:SAM-dependent methyltransferase
MYRLAPRGIEAGERTIGLEPLPFDSPAAQGLVRARIEVLDQLLANWRSRQLSTVLDVGTGVGYVAGHLANSHGFEVTALDIRDSNVIEARRRNLKPRFLVADIEDVSSLSLGNFDLVVAFGLLYHLENPARAIRHLVQMTRHLLIVESMIAPGRLPQAQMIDEFPGADQGVRYFAFHPTESGLVKLLYRAGMQYVYTVKPGIDNPDFRRTLFKRRMRTLLAATRSPFDTRILQIAPEPFLKLDRA